MYKQKNISFFVLIRLEIFIRLMYRTSQESLESLQIIQFLQDIRDRKQTSLQMFDSLVVAFQF